MKALRASVTAALVAALTVVGLVVNAGSAAADPRSDNLSNYGPLVGGGEYQTPAQALQQMRALCAIHPKKCEPASGVIFYGPIGPSNPGVVGAIPAYRWALNQVQQFCRPAHLCVSLAGAGGLLTALETTDVEKWVDWGQVDNTEAGLKSAPVQYYPSTQTGGTVSGTGLTVLEPSDTTAPQYALQADVMNINFAPSGCGTASTFTVRWAVDVVRKSTGAWSHDEFSFSDICRAQYPVQYFTMDTTGSSMNGSEYELRRVHFIQDGSRAGITPVGRGFYWGQEIVGATDEIYSSTRCQRPDGSIYPVITEAIGVDAGGVNVAPCEAGDTPISNAIFLVRPDGTEELQSMLDLTPVELDPNAPPPWQDCQETECLWFVEYNGQQCTVGKSGCTTWTTNKQNAKCFYGPYEMPLTYCSWLERAYEVLPVRPPATEPNQDGDPDTHEGPAVQPQPAPTPAPTRPPVKAPTTVPTPTPTGSPTASPTINPGHPDPTTRPTTSSTASPTGSASPQPSPLPPGGSGIPSPSDTVGSRCFPTGWAAFNPVQWVLQPMRCALEPDPVLTRARVDSVTATLGTAGPGPALTEIGGLLDTVPTGNGCKGPGWTFTLGGYSTTLYLLDACEAPMSTVAMYAKAVTTVVVSVLGGFGVARALAGAFGFNLTMGRGTPDA